MNGLWGKELSLLESDAENLMKKKIDANTELAFKSLRPNATQNIDE